MSKYISKPPTLVVGTGFGCRIHVPALRSAGFDVVGLVGADANRTKERAQLSGVPQAFTDLDEAIARTGAVVVTIATPPNTHAPLVLAALSRGCHVLCEKPFAMHAGEARAMFEAAKRAGVVHFIGHELRWASGRALMGRAIANGLIGKTRFVTLAQYVDLVASPDAVRPKWWFDEASGGGWLGASGSHVIDQVRVWFGEFSSVSAALPIVSARESVAEDSFVVRFRLADGADGMLQNTGGAWGPVANMTRVAGTDGTLWLENGAVWLADREGSREIPAPPELVLAPMTRSEGPRGSDPGGGDPGGGDRASSDSRGDDRRTGDQRNVDPRNGGQRTGNQRNVDPHNGGQRTGNQRNVDSHNGDQRTGDRHNVDSHNGDQRTGDRHNVDPRNRFMHLELPPYTRLCETLRAAIDGSTAECAVQPATFYDGVACMEVLDAIRQSAATGGALVTLPN